MLEACAGHVILGSKSIYVRKNFFRKGQAKGAIIIPNPVVLSLVFVIFL